MSTADAEIRSANEPAAEVCAVGVLGVDTEDEPPCPTDIHPTPAISAATTAIKATDRKSVV